MKPIHDRYLHLTQEEHPYNEVLYFRVSPPMCCKWIIIKSGQRTQKAETQGIEQLEFILRSLQKRMSCQVHPRCVHMWIQSQTVYQSLRRANNEAEQCMSPTPATGLCTCTNELNCIAETWKHNCHGDHNAQKACTLNATREIAYKRATFFIAHKQDQV